MTRIVMSRLLGLSVGLFLSIVSPVDACTPVPMAFTMMGNILSGPLMLQMLGAVALVTALKVGLFWRANRGEISFFRLLGAIVAANVASTLYFLIAVIMMEATGFVMVIGFMLLIAGFAVPFQEYLELYLGDTRKRHVLNGVGTVVFVAGCMLLPGSHRMVQFLVDQRYATYWVVKILTLAFIFGAGLCYTTIAEVAAVRRLLGKEDDANFQRTLFPQMFRVNAGALIIGLFLFAGLTLPVRFRSEGFLF